MSLTLLSKGSAEQHRASCEEGARTREQRAQGEHLEEHARRALRMRGPGWSHGCCQAVLRYAPDRQAAGRAAAAPHPHVHLLRVVPWRAQSTEVRQRAVSSVQAALHAAAHRL